MRTMGVYRGNPTLRVAIGQALRRRLYAELVPHDASRGAVPGAGEADALDRRWSREFHDALRVHALPLMAPIERTAEGVLRYFGRPGFSLWALHSDHTLVLAYDYHDTPEELRARARRWAGCLRTRTAPGMANRHWGQPVYGARLDAATDDLEVVWAVPGDWMRLADAENAAERTRDVPLHWSEAAEVA